jgi:pimeloyl-ACP methyl ester carboxylesterase
LALAIVLVSPVSALVQTTTAPPVLGDTPPKETTTAAPVLGDTPASSSFRSQKECFHEPIFGDSACVYQVNREAPRTVVLVHGIGGQAEDWETVIPGLAAQYHVLAVDLPGFGASTRANRLYSVERYASFLHFVIERYAKQPIELVGHSLGGAVSLWYAATYPRDVERLVLIDVAGVLHRMSLAKLAANRWLADVLGGLPVPGRMLGGWMDKMIGRAGNLPVNAALVLRTAVTRERVLGGDPSRISAFALAETDFTDMIPRVTVPTLVVWGTRDETASIRTGQVLAARLANARLVTVESDHVPMRAQPQRLLELTLAHLSGQEIVPSWPVHPIPPPNAPATSGRCDGERNVKFEGAFDVLQIRGCSYVQVDNARIRQLDVADSTVFLTNCVVEGGDVAARLVNADVTATAVDISGEVALSVDNSNLDLAGVRIEGRSAAIVGTERPSGIIISVSRIESPNTRDSTIHDTLRASAENPL